MLDPAGAMLADRERVDTPAAPTPAGLVDALVRLVRPLPAFDRVSIGFPGVVRDGRVLTAPHFGDDGWRGFPLAQVLGERLGGKPARLLNDAEVQGYGVIAGRGLELVLTLGTGLGSALFRDGPNGPGLTSTLAAFATPADAVRALARMRAAAARCGRSGSDPAIRATAPTTGGFAFELTFGRGSREERGTLLAGQRGRFVTTVLMVGTAAADLDLAPDVVTTVLGRV